MLAEMAHLRNENKILQAQLDNPSTDRGHQNQTSTTSFMGAGDDVAHLKKKFKKEEELRKNFADLAKKREDELKK
tara:strand:- start:1160 stop:1384 length:225 start_codon:yes stop_codon:yes gene_type:complete